MKDATDLQLVEDFLTHNVWFLEWESGVRTSGLSIKAEPSGFLAVIKGRSAEGPQVAFLGKSSIKAIVDQLRTVPGRAAIKWRADQFALDNLEKKR